MSDRSLGRMLRQVGDDPTDEFVTTLRRDLLAEFADGISTRVDSWPGDNTNNGQDDESFAVVEPIGVRRVQRPWLAMVAAAAVAAAMVAGAVLVTRPPRASITATPNEGRGFSLQMSTDMTTSDGYGFHFDGTIELALAVESNESSSQPLHDVLLIPKISGTLTSTSTGRTAPLSLAYVELFLSGDVGPCIVNAAGCEAGIVRGQSTSPDPPPSLLPGASFGLIDAAQSSRISVPAGDVADVIEQVRTGTIVTGIALVVAGATVDDVTSTIVDRTGKEVLTCNSLPDDCMDPARSVLGGDAAPIPVGNGVGGTGVDVPSPLPTAEAPAGVYSTTSFRVPLTVTTTEHWQVVDESNSTIFFGRIADNSKRVSEAIVLAIVAHPVSATAEQVLTTICPNTVTFGPTKSTTIIGHPGFEALGTATGNCSFNDGFLSTALPAGRGATGEAGDTVRVTWANIGDGRLFVVFAYARAIDWSKFTTELDSTISSLTTR